METPGLFYVAKNCSYIFTYKYYSGIEPTEHSG